MYNKIFSIITLLFLSYVGVSQNNTNSAYSAFGVGEIAKPGFSRNHAMGGVAQGVRSPNHINYLNPASYCAQDSFSFIFEFGLLNNITNIETSELKENSSNTNIHHLAIAFPLKKWWFGSIGLMPYSNIGYNIEENIQVVNDSSNILYEGSGGINQLFFGNSFKLNKNFSIGINASYLFGSIQKTETQTFTTLNNSLPTVIEDYTNIGSWIFQLGIQYTNNFKNGLDYIVGMTLGNKTNIDSKNEHFVNNNVISIVESTNREHFTIPSNLCLGFIINKDNKLIYGADYNWQNWGKTSNLDSLANSNSFNFGLEYTPNRYAGANFLKRISYRFGGRYENTYLRINGKQLKDYGMSFGLGIPIKRSKSSLNIAFEMGSKGTTINNLIQENYKIITLSLSLYDYWFFKRKFD